MNKVIVCSEEYNYEGIKNINVFSSYKNIRSYLINEYGKAIDEIPEINTDIVFNLPRFYKDKRIDDYYVIRIKTKEIM